MSVVKVVLYPKAVIEAARTYPLVVSHGGFGDAWNLTLQCSTFGTIQFNTIQMATTPRAAVCWDDFLCSASNGKFDMLSCVRDLLPSPSVSVSGSVVSLLLRSNLET
eukprot:822399-Amphidinium_carterae.2